MAPALRRAVISTYGLGIAVSASSLAVLSASRGHLEQTGETYAEHMRFALTVGSMAIGAGLACVIHAFVPAICQSTCSRTVGQLQWLFADRRRLAEISEAASGVTAFVELAFVATSTAAFVAASGAGAFFALLAAALCLALPLIYLAQNPALDPL